MDLPAKKKRKKKINNKKISLEISIHELKNLSEEHHLNLSEQSKFTIIIIKCKFFFVLITPISKKNEIFKQQFCCPK